MADWANEREIGGGMFIAWIIASGVRACNVSVLQLD